MSMDVLDAHKSKAKTSMACISTMTFILDFLSLCINMDSTITAITTHDSPLPILRQFLIKFIRLINNTEWALLDISYLLALQRSYLPRNHVVIPTQVHSLYFSRYTSHHFIERGKTCLL